ncbi:MAG: alanine--tRNA ligase-related protein, partial [Patescibacteria group bacterium]
MSSAEIRQKFLDFFKARGHTIVPSSSLIPDDPSVLLTTAGMQQFKPYYSELDPTTTIHPSIGKPIGKNTASCQKSFRTSDIDEVGDESHLTFFEMLGNFSFGGYFKKEAIQYAHEFITKEMGLKISYVTVFEGKENIGVPKDTESRDIWKSLDPNLEVREEGMSDVFWGPTGTSGPCGPTTEIYCKNATGQDIEVWNIVFNQYFYPGSREELNSGVAGKKLESLKTPGVDTGMGLERLVMCVQKTKTIFETDLFAEPFSPWSVLSIGGVDIRYNRIFADHLRGAIFLIADGVRPSNKGAGYVLRRLVRRVVVSSKKMGLSDDNISQRLDKVITYYSSSYKDYKNLVSDKKAIEKILIDEEKKFEKTLEIGLREFGKRYPALNAQSIKLEEKREKYVVHIPQTISGRDAFNLHQSYGFTIDILRDLAK